MYQTAINKLKPSTRARIRRGIKKYGVTSQPIGFIWASPPCEHHGAAKFSKARGGR